MVHYQQSLGPGVYAPGSQHFLLKNNSKNYSKMQFHKLVPKLQRNIDIVHANVHFCPLLYVFNVFHSNHICIKYLPYGVNFS
jgi:hypothetical protein